MGTGAWPAEEGVSVSVVSAEVAANVLNGRRFGDDRKGENLVLVLALVLALSSCVVDVDDRAENLDDDDDGGTTRTHWRATGATCTTKEETEALFVTTAAAKQEKQVIVILLIAAELLRRAFIVS